MDAVFIIITIVIIYLVVRFFKNGSKRRAKIISDLILVAEANGGEFTTDAVYYEAVEKFALEHGGSVLTKDASYIVIGENRISFLRLADIGVIIQIENEEELRQDSLDRASGRGKYAPKKDVNILLEDFNNSLPEKINEQITLSQVFGNDELVWMIFNVPDRGTVEEDKKVFDLVKEAIKDTSFVNNIRSNGTKISIQILTENGKNVVTASLDDGY